MTGWRRFGHFDKSPSFLTPKYHHMLVFSWAILFLPERDLPEYSGEGGVDALASLSGPGGRRQPGP